MRTLILSSLMLLASTGVAIADDLVAEITFTNGEKPTVPKNQKKDVVAAVTFKDNTKSELHLGDYETYWKLKGQNTLQLWAKPKAKAYGFGVVSNKKALEVQIKVDDGEFETTDSKVLDFDGKTALKVQVKK